MSAKSGSHYQFGDHRVDISEQTMHKGDEQIALTPKAFETLVFFLENPGRLIQKNELMENLWPDRFVEEGNLTFHVGMLRKALGDAPATPHYIQTVPKCGYKFIAEVIRESGPIPHRANGDTPKLTEEFLTPETFPETGPNFQAAGHSSYRRKWPFAVLAMLAIAGVTGFFFLARRPSFYDRFASSGYLTVEKLTETGTAIGANISPDGKFLLYHTDEGGRSTLWLRQTANGNTISLLTLTDGFFSGKDFSADGEYIFFTVQRKGEPLVLSRIPKLGGSPVNVVSGLHGWTFSPDDTKIAFSRIDDQGTHLIVADADGQNEQEVFVSPKQQYSYGFDWSPDGNSIAYYARSGGNSSGIYQLKLADRTQSKLTDFNWSFVENLSWLPDQSGLLVTGREKNEDPLVVWLVRYPGGTAKPITQDSLAISFRGATADYSRMVATQKWLDSELWIAPAGDPSAVSPIGQAEYELAWTTDGKLIYQARSSVKSNLWRTNVDGSERRQITLNDSRERAPAVSPDGRFVAYVSTKSGRPNVWRMKADGTDQVALTGGEGESFPAITHDSNWVVFTSASDGSLWRVPSIGGEAEQMCSDRIARIGISPDGKQFAHIGRNKENQRKLIVRAFSDCSILREFDVAIITAVIPKVVWAKDGNAILYAIDDAAFVGNVWQQPLRGGEPKKLTNFTSKQIFDFDFSPDGTQIAFIRGRWLFDVVSIQGLQ
jgi:Tol biopolymer transport system component/DNA-binding winged helix-turn-helix (wHTH) protein